MRLIVHLRQLCTVVLSGRLVCWASANLLQLAKLQGVLLHLVLLLRSKVLVCRVVMNEQAKLCYLDPLSDFMVFQKKLLINTFTGTSRSHRKFQTSIDLHGFCM